MTSGSWRTPMMVLVLGTLILLLSFGLRQNLGLYLAPVSADLGWGRDVLSFAAGLQLLVWGAATPFMGFLADRYGPAKVVAVGGALYAAGLFIMSQASSPLDATIGVGVLMGFALSMTGFPIVLSVIGRSVSPAKRSLYLGIASAGGSSGQLVLVPIGQGLIDGAGPFEGLGWIGAMVVLAALAAVIVPLSVALIGGNKRAADDHANQNIGEALTEAARHKGFKLLVLGYFVCGFQTMFIGQHLPAYLTDLGQSPWLGATALSLIGLFNIIGCVIWGQLGGRYSKKYLLAVLYFTRAMVIAVFIMTPITPTSVIVFASVMGLMWLGTVPLTTGVVVQIFGTQFMSTLVGVTFVSHNIGGFLGTWLGGVIYDAYGSYDPIFWGGVFFGVVAAFIHYPIDDRPLPRLSMPQPQAA